MVFLSMPGYLDRNKTITVNAEKTAEYSTRFSIPGKTPVFGVIGSVLSIGGLLVIWKIRKYIFFPIVHLSRKAITEQLMQASIQ